MTPPDVRPNKAVDVSTGVVQLVDETGVPTGETMSKLAAHQGSGHLHLAFSAFLFDERDRLIIQRRATTKYHFPGRWSNTCCSHPRPGTPLLEYAKDRIHQELGVDCQTLEEVGAFRYSATDRATGLVEREFDHVLVGYVHSEMVLSPDPDEVQEIGYVTVDELHEAVRADPESFTPWLVEAMAVVESTGHPRPDQL